MMYMLTRASLINKEVYYEYSLVGQFLSDNLTFEKKRFIGVVDCRRAFDVYLEERSLDYVAKKIDFKLDLISSCQLFYGKPIRNKRRDFSDGRKRLAFIGIRVREDSEKAPIFKIQSVVLTDEIWKDYSRQNDDYSYQDNEIPNVIDVVTVKSEEEGTSSKQIGNPIRYTKRKSRKCRRFKSSTR